MASLEQVSSEPEEIKRQRGGGHCAAMAAPSLAFYLFRLESRLLFHELLCEGEEE